MDGLLSRAEPTNEVVAFLLAERSSGERLTSQQHSSQLNVIAIKTMMVDWSRFDLWSVCIFLSIEKPRSESALETGMERRPAINRCSRLNLGCPSKVTIFPISDQNNPAFPLMVPSAPLYFTTEGRSPGDSL